MIDFAINSKYIEKLVICGTGPLKKYVLQKAEHPKIEYLGYVKDISKQYYSNRYLLHFAEYDTYPCTILESALCGCFPIINKSIGNSYLFSDKFKLENLKDDNEINQKISWIEENEKEAEKLLTDTAGKIKFKDEAISHFQKTFYDLVNQV